MRQSRSKPGDAPLTDLDLADIDWRRVDLPAELERPERNRIWPQWLMVLFLAGIGGLIVWFPQSDLYQTYSRSSALFFAMCGVAVLVGIFLARNLWRLMQRAAERADTPRRLPERPLGPWARALILLAALAGGAALLFALPAREQIAPGGDDALVWFAVAGAALVVGLLLVRWLFAQQSVAALRPVRRIAARLPGWVKWITLAILIAAALVTGLGPSWLTGPDPAALEFSLGTVGFLLGIFAAIWLARRFDETEQKLKERAATRGRSDRRPRSIDTTAH